MVENDTCILRVQKPEKLGNHECTPLIGFTLLLVAVTVSINDPIHMDYWKENDCLSAYAQFLHVVVVNIDMPPVFE